VSGEHTASAKPHSGICSSGTKTPEMKTSGNLINEESITMFDGTFVGGTASNIPIAEKQHAARKIAARSVMPWKRESPSASPMKTVIVVIAMPKRREAIISPKTIASTVIGQEASRSRVFACPSHGNMAGDTAVAVKKSVIPTNPEMRKARDSCLLPMKKARKRNTGMKIPKMSTGPLK